MKETEKDFTHEELDIIKSALNNRYSDLRNTIDSLNKSDDAIGRIKEQQEKVEIIMEKINDLIVYGEVNKYTEEELKKVLLDSFKQID